MIEKLRSPTREDWNDISKLRFRNFDAKIIAVNVFDESIGLSNYNVRVIYSLPNGVKEITEHSIAGKWFPIESRNRNKDIVVEEPEEIDYEEIVKELAAKGAYVTYDHEYYCLISWINIRTKRFCTRELNWAFEKTCGFNITFDFKTVYTFDEYLELRKKEQDNG